MRLQQMTSQSVNLRPIAGRCRSRRAFDYLPLAAICAAALCLAGEPHRALADDGIVVRGNGSATARPTQIEISATLSGEAELAADAMVKFRDAKKRALAAIASLKNPDLAIESEGVSVGGGGSDANAQMMAMRGMSVPNTAKSVRLSESSRIILNHADALEPNELLDKLLKILDVAKDAGFQVGPSAAQNFYQMQMEAQMGETGTSVSFKLPDSSALRQKAYKAAIDDARAKAESLAQLSGVKLGRIVAVRENDVASSENPQTVVYLYGGSSSKSGGQDKSLTGSTSGELTLRASVTVQFEIVK